MLHFPSLRDYPLVTIIPHQKYVSSSVARGLLNIPLITTRSGGVFFRLGLNLLTLTGWALCLGIAAGHWRG
jgi:hypothetical protein